MKTQPRLGHEIRFSDLAQYSPWPKRLLGQEPFKSPERNSEEITREFNDEKWFELSNIVSRNKNWTLSDLESSVFSGTDELYFEDGHFYRTGGIVQLERHLDIFAKILGQYTAEAQGLVELGAGYGSKILRFCKLPAFADLEYFGLEFTELGREIIKELADREHIDINVGFCNFFEPIISDIAIPEHSVLFTSYSLMYLPVLPSNFIQSILDLKPSVVVHFEPCYSHYEDASIHHLMCKKYTDLNNYNTDLCEVLNELAAEGKLEILQEIRAYFGANPFLPLSTVVWRPSRSPIENI